jgi:hypothetical protein
MEVINEIMFTYCILHNIIVEHEKDVEGLEDIILVSSRESLP